QAYVLPPGTRIGPVSPGERAETLKSSGLGAVYDKVEDRDSAYEKLAQKVTERGAAAPAPAAGDQPQESGGLFGALGDLLGGSTGPRGGRREGAIEAATKSAARAIGSQLGRQIVRGVLGGLLGGGTTTRRR
ncbi:MAG TPA: helicase HerA-like domain-containing protein, partial [Burkholderiales bacterium]|nr:helicase HerA-like domain-containing protein [Burkholderiales bacterium]